MCRQTESREKSEINKQKIEKRNENERNPNNKQTQAIYACDNEAISPRYEHSSAAPLKNKHTHTHIQKRGERPHTHREKGRGREAGLLQQWVRGVGSRTKVMAAKQT